MRKKLVKICIGWPVVMVVLSLGLFGRYRFFWSRVEISLILSFFSFCFFFASSPTTRKERIRIAGRVGKASVLRLADPHHPQTTGLVQLCFYLLRKGKGKG